MLDCAQGLGRAFELRLVRSLDKACDVFLRTWGVYVVHTLYYDARDIDVIDTYGEGIHHYATYNAGTKLLQLNPEVLILMVRDIYRRASIYHYLSYIVSGGMV